jgi:Mrp family chromosome partitioning ATPase/predicted Fe-Mo cluster-binding NifX family protein
MAEGAGAREEERERRTERLARRMGRIAHKVLVLSGKGGVGKSTVAVNLAAALREAGMRAGLLDVDVHGPSVPKLLGLDGVSISLGPESGDGEVSMLPVEADGIEVMSVAFLLQGAGDPVIWRGPMKHGAIGQLLGDTEWGELDWLVIDAPPGTGDEPLSVCQLVPDADGAVVVTTPQELSVADVRRSIGFCRQVGMKVLGVIENMSGFVCPKCGGRVDVFKTGGGRRLAEEMRVPFLGAVPLDPMIVGASDEGRPFVEQLRGSAAAEAFSGIVSAILGSAGEASPGRRSTPAGRVESGGRPARQEPGPPAGGDEQMPQRTGSARRFAIPTARGKLSLHFGHCEAFAIIDASDGEIVGREDAQAPEAVPGVLPKWLAERGVNVIIAGGMGQRAQGLFAEYGIEVATGAPRGEPEELVRAYLAGTLATGENICDH